MVDPILQRSLGMRECFCAASKLHFFADVVPPLLTSVALFARLPYFEGYFISRRKFLDHGSDGDDDACGLMAKRHRLANDDVAVTVVPIVMQVRTTETG